MKRGKTSNLSFMLLMLVILMGISYLWQSSANEGKITYSQVRQLFVQERVSAFTVSDNTLTMKLNQPMADGRDTVRYELDDVQWFKEDLGELVVQQAQKGIITAYDYQASSTSVWLQMVPYLLMILMIGFMFWFMVIRSQGGGMGPDKMSKFGSAHVRTISEKDKTITEDEQKKAEADVQKLTDRFVAETDKKCAAKEKEIMDI